MAFASAALGRVGMVMGAMWLAWPSLQQPARWLPAGAPLLCVIAMVVLAANPMGMVPFVVPATGILIALGAITRGSRGDKRR